MLGFLLPFAYQYLVKESCGMENIGFTKKDAYNYPHVVRTSLIEVGDSQSLVNHLKNKVNEEGLFYWYVQLHEEGQMVNFFWIDGRSRIDYDYFGDVSFNTTY